MLQRPSARIVAALAIAGAVALLWRGTESVERFSINLVATYAALWCASVLISPSRRRLLLFGGITTTALLGLGAGLAELPALTGLLDYRLVFGTPTLSLAHDPRNLTDEELIFRRQPHDRLQGTSPGNIAAQFHVPDAAAYTFDVPYDANGFRNPADHGSASVVVLGDSFVEGPYVADADILTARLAQSLGVTVANLGMSSYGPQQQRLTLQRYGLPLRPRVVVHLFFEGNDLTDVHTYRRFRREGPEARHSFYYRSFVRNLLWAVYNVAGRPRPTVAPRTAYFRSAGNEVPVYFLYPGEPLDASDVEALDVVKESMAEMERLSAAAGARYVIAFAPIKLRALDGQLEIPNGSLVGSWQLNDLPERVASIVRDLGPNVDYVDLTPYLAAAARSGELPYLADDSHWNAAGHRVAAEALADVVGRALQPAAPSAAAPSTSPSPTAAAAAR